ncbi:acetyltransferase [Ferrimonas marina]|uniref:Sugar O-acyltransferase, sialic acid O-acetyltransferase NeuD family n=1 Tax=Ferrimonas marina TaxID=299255 RepID=A0A1M5QUN5_9GAMM|nr:acetyltransferase [Ferrimonas marina]SHH17668.1 sugar O-acyltransferase, sialic acid O-acetyltransferase NeuD family [Ferrimonas marina]
MSKPVVVLGAGGHAAVLVDLLTEQGRAPLALVAPERPAGREALAALPLLSEAQLQQQWTPQQVELVNGIGMLPGDSLRQRVFERFSALGYGFATLVCDSARVSRFARLAPGSQVLSGAIVQAGAEIGANSLINTAASVDHDCRLAAHVHIAPGARLCGQVQIGEGAFVGANATVIQGLTIGSEAIVGAASLLKQDLAAQTRWSLNMTGGGHG